MSLDTKLKQLKDQRRHEQQVNSLPLKKQQCKACGYLSFIKNTDERQLMESKKPKSLPLFDQLFNMIKDQISNLKQALREISQLQQSKIGVKKQCFVKLSHYLQNSQKIQIYINQQLNIFLPHQSSLIIPKTAGLGVDKINLKENAQENAEPQVCQNKVDHSKTEKLGYQLVEKYSYCTNNCSAIAIDYQKGFVIASCSREIKIFLLTDDKLVEYQIMKQQTKDAHLLLFMQKSQDFISAGKDGNICIWKKFTNKYHQFQWKHLQTINCEQSEIQCVTIDSKNKYLVCGSSDENQSKIRFIKQFNSKWQQDFEFLIQGKIQNICFNDSNDFLVAASDNELVILLKLHNPHCKWYKLQTLCKKKYGSQIFFINNSQFAIQSMNGNFLFIYDYKINLLSEGELGQFKKTKRIEFNHLSQFPLRYLQQEKIIIARNNDSINLFQYAPDGCFQMYGNLIEAIREGEIVEISHDGEYLISWDCQNLRLIFRQLRRTQ